MAFLRFRTYSPGDTRYLFPLYPVLFLSIALLADHVLAWSGRLRAVGVGLLAAALLAHGIHQFQSRNAFASESMAQHPVEQIQEIIQQFRSAGVELVYSTNYWHSNQYTYFSRLDPVFMVPGEVTLRHPRGVELAKTVERAGLLSGIDEQALPEIEINGARWRVSPLGQVGSRRLSVIQRLASSP
jgi:hypothetical protein